MRFDPAYIRLLPIFLACAVTAHAEAPSQCTCRTLTLAGGLPRNAIGKYETDPVEFAKRPSFERPVIQVALDQQGYEGQSLYVRVAKAAAHTWQAEIFHVDPAHIEDATPVDIFGPLGFSKNGASVNKFCGETRTAAQTPQNFGDHLYLCFNGLQEEDVSEQFSVASVKTEFCPCFEYAKTLVGPDDLRDPDSPYRTKIYSPEEGTAVMLKGHPAGAD